MGRGKSGKGHGAVEGLGKGRERSERAGRGEMSVCEDGRPGTSSMRTGSVVRSHVSDLELQGMAWHALSVVCRAEDGRLYTACAW